MNAWTLPGSTKSSDAGLRAGFNVVTCGIAAAIVSFASVVRA